MKQPAPHFPRSADDRAALISALVDGESAALQPGCELWRDDAQARTDWHTYHLIGDVMRSDDLACEPARDAAFLLALRARLAQEPAVLAPQPKTAPARRPTWLVPAAAAAGFAAVAGVLAVTRLSAPASEGPTLAVEGSHGGGMAVNTRGALPAQALVIEGRLIRDERLDVYLRAHREASNGFAVAVPGGMPRNIETLAPAPVMPVANAVSR
jgi:sigma-E factor negative regulatory protein RseA